MNLKFRLRRCFRRLPEGVTMMLLAGATGTAAGVAAWVLKWTIGRLCTAVLALADTVWWPAAAMPVAGILAAVAFQRYVAHRSLEHGTDTLTRALAEHRYVLDAGLTWQPVLAAIITLGFGGSAGAEGPIAISGGAIGSRIAKAFGLPEEMRRVMMGCGAGAGIAGIFKAPIAGLLFTLEVLKVRMNTLSVLALTVAAICGGLSCYALTGFSFDIAFLPTAFFDPSTLGWVALLGLWCGFYSAYYNRMTALLHRFFGSISNRWWRALAGGAIVGTCVLLFPCLFGEGYDTLTELVNGRTHTFAVGALFDPSAPDAVELLLMAAAVMLLKVFACIASNSSGGVGGDFAPTIFAGAFAGLVFGLGVNAAFDAKLPVGLCCLFGAAGTFAGVIHAPLMSIFLVSEIVGNGYGFVLPLAVTALVSYLTVKALSPKSKYDAARHDDFAALAATPTTGKAAEMPEAEKSGPASN